MFSSMLVSSGNRIRRLCPQASPKGWASLSVKIIRFFEGIKRKWRRDRRLLGLRRKCLARPLRSIHYT